MEYRIIFSLYLTISNSSIYCNKTCFRTYFYPQYVVLVGEQHYGRWGNGSQGFLQIYKRYVVKIGVPIEQTKAVIDILYGDFLQIYL